MAFCKKAKEDFVERNIDKPKSCNLFKNILLNRYLDECSWSFSKQLLFGTSFADFSWKNSFVTKK